jgi:hypothetical protein
MSAWVASKVGWVIQDTVPAGAPASWAARAATRTASVIHFRALGWGEKITGFPAFRQISVL